MNTNENCVCTDEQCPAFDFAWERIGTQRDGFGAWQVSRLRCLTCGSAWLRASMEDDAAPAWARWFRAPIPDDLRGYTVESALEELGRASWHFYGGRYYGTAGERSSGAVPVPQASEALAA